jgi:hypothetical protein
VALRALEGARGSLGTPKIPQDTPRIHPRCPRLTFEFVSVNKGDFGNLAGDLELLGWPAEPGLHILGVLGGLWGVLGGSLGAPLEDLVGFGGFGRRKGVSGDPQDPPKTSPGSPPDAPRLTFECVAVNRGDFGNLGGGPRGSSVGSRNVEFIFREVLGGLWEVLGTACGCPWRTWRPWGALEGEEEGSGDCEDTSYLKTPPDPPGCPPVDF